MIATVILGVIVAAIFGVGIYNLYSNFFKGTSTCCKTSGSCANCPMSKTHDNYRTRIEAIEKFKLKKVIDVEGMTCERCTAAVSKALESIEGVAIAAASVEKQSAEVALDFGVSDELLKEAVRKAGYQPGSVLPVN
ncbi:MAG: heavy-metal-associated domain-containing protein [Selenomonadaceae bacterium]|nr:heavy-metal-associated domain-containing protein [Selenomonadaceae bacterium]